MAGFLEELITEYRGIFVVLFVLPLSFCFDLALKFRAYLIHQFFSAPLLHDKRVKDIQTQVRAHALRNDGTKMCTRRPGWMSISPGFRSYKAVSNQIAVDLYDILSWSEQAKSVTVEPMVNMGQLSHFLIPKGYTLPVLPEMDDLTVGGLFMGVGIETSSHKFGLFNDSILSADVVLADGKLVTCSREANRDLFDALPWSYGTLGLLVSCTIRIVPCKPYVRVQYIPIKSQEESVKKFIEYASKCDGKDATDFVEALAYSETEMVLMPAYYASKEEAESSGLVNTISWWWKPWFYKHVETILRGGKPTIEYIPLRDYYHRHTKSIFWEAEDILPFGNNWIFRWSLGWLMPPKVSFLKLTTVGPLRKKLEEAHVIQDMLLPVSQMAKGLDAFKTHYDLFPLWICPYRAYDYSTAPGAEGHRYFLRKPQANSTDNKTGMKYEMYVDLGAYGIPKAVRDKQPFDAVEKGQIVETIVMENRGFQMLYADSYLSQTDFERMFDHTHYQKMKKQYDPKSAFPTVFEKVCKKAQVIWKEREASVKKST
eukprot:gb/GEZN01003870.1/.p1 GENE.gb/GEZN01003870.1/~~gb/GEZN01003870.1/.p1  ORF type:complete len:541 (+),score=51.93 gb/GEZN01003870.1/:28-1650(+)